MKKGKITDWLIKSNVIQAEDRDLYDYACRSLAFLFAPFVIALVVGMVFRMVAEALLMAVPYVVLRSFCGGFHLKSIKLCLVVSTLSYLAIFSIGVFVSCDIFYYVTAVISAVSIDVLSPIVSPDKRIGSGRILHFKLTAIILSTIILIGVFVLFIMHIGHFSRFLTLGMLLTASLQWPCIGGSHIID